MQPTITLSKSRLLAYRQCERRLWLEIHRQDLISVQRKVLKEFLRSSAVADMAEVPDELLNAIQRTSRCRFSSACTRCKRTAG